jgi:hypothetical protein
MANTISHSELLKATKKAVNSLMFNPSASKKQSAIEAIASLSEFIDSIDAPKEQPKPKASKSKKKPKASKAKPKASKSKSKSSRKAEIEAVLTSGKKLKRSERSVLNKELHALLQEEREAARKASKKSSKKSSKKTVRRPKRSSAAGLEQAQAKQNTANKVGKVQKTKVVNAVDGGEAQPFEPRKEVQIVEPKVRKKEQMKLTLLPGESPEEAMARLRSARLEQERLEAEALISSGNPMLEPSFAPAV